ncbi:hypothetical protein Leryth_027181 [Lithospermum erythrorhizon]|nr:hypothetical protein Leryth_027181 [Lithospermum erythrorhizon]
MSLDVYKRLHLISSCFTHIRREMTRERSNGTTNPSIATAHNYYGRYKPTIFAFGHHRRSHIHRPRQLRRCKIVYSYWCRGYLWRSGIFEDHDPLKQQGE